MSGDRLHILYLVANRDSHYYMMCLPGTGG